MKTENSRLGRCSSCRHWKSAADMLAERTGPEASPEEVQSTRITIRSELTADILSIAMADYRGWCTAAETGETGPGELMAINLTTSEPARMITAHDFGCLNYCARPRRAMNAPPADFTHNPYLGRCKGCRFWSSAENEANALVSIARYTNPHASMPDAEREARNRLSPKPLAKETAGNRGWCKAASDYTKTEAKNLATDPSTGAVGAMITNNDFACVRHQDITNPLLKTSPDWRWMINPSKIYNLGASAPINELLWSYIDPATLLDENHPLSPLHPEHPLNLRNPRSLYYNPNPAFAAFVMNSSAVNRLIDPNAYRADTTGVRGEAVTDANRSRTSLAFTGRPSSDNEMMRKQLIAQARLAQDFSSRTLKINPVDLAPEKTAAVSLAKKGDKLGFPDRRKGPKVEKPAKRPNINKGPDRRKIRD